MFDNFIDTLDFAELIAILAFVIMGLVIAIGRKRLVSSDNNIVHAIGRALKWKDLLILMAVLACVSGCKRGISGSEMIEDIYYPAVSCSLAVYLLTVFKRFVLVCDLDNRQKDSYNHLLQTLILVCIGIFLVFIILHFNIDDKTFLPFSFIAAVLGLIFNDSIKGLVAYYHLRANNLLHIGDWIEVPSQNIDGVIAEITLVTVSVRNWDNTVSNVSIASLQNGAFKNNQYMSDGKTTGRLIDCTFIVDTSSINSMTAAGMTELRQRLESIGADTVFMDRIENRDNSYLNIHLYRLYISHWLMNNPELTRYPRLIVSLNEPAPDGMPLQIRAFSIKTAFIQFETVQSSVIEYVMLSMEWFGLRLYQKPSLEDMSLFK